MKTIVIGDIHGCYDELEILLGKLGYVRKDGVFMHPYGRRAAFLGDLCDRGMKNTDVLRLVMDMVKAGNAVSVPGNHDIKLLKYLRGKNIAMTHGIDKTIAELRNVEKSSRRRSLSLSMVLSVIIFLMMERSLYLMPDSSRSI